MTAQQNTHPHPAPFARSLDPDAELRTVPAHWDTSALPTPAQDGEGSFTHTSPQASSTAGPVDTGSPFRSSSAPELGYLDEPESAGFRPSHSYRCGY